MATRSGGNPPRGENAVRDLRRRAEERLKTTRAAVSRMAAGDVEALVTELQVHQIELEIQNEELRDAQAELAQVRDRYTELYNFAPVGYLTLDGRGVVRESNQTAAKILGIQRRELVGHNVARWVVPEDADGWYLYLQNVANSEESVTTELRLRRPDGVFWAHLQTRRGSPAANDSPEYWMTFSDITHRREAEERLKVLTATLKWRAAELQRLAAQLSSAEERERRRIALLLHDGLQQDLVALRFRLDILAKGSGGGAADEASLSELGPAIDECVARTRELSYDLSPPVLVSGLLPALEWLSRDVGRRHGLQVTLVATPGAEPVNPGLSPLLFRSVKELLLNVRKHSGTSSAEVTASRTDQGLQVRVIDKGKGFEAAALKKSTSNASGLGLLGIEERVHLMGGGIDIESRPGHGCRVTLSVPDSAEGAAAPPPAGPPDGYGAEPEVSSVSARVPLPATPIPSAVIRILLADDHASVRQGLADLLAREKDLEVVAQATNGKEAVLLASELRPDVVLMDVSMPEMDGFEATSRIMRLLPHIRIIGLSIQDDSFVAEKMIQSGAVAYLCKSDPPPQLVEAVRTAGTRRPA